MFDDGTFFDGDRFRLSSIIEKEEINEDMKVKINKRENISEVLAKVKFHQVFQFYLETPLDLVTERDHVKIQIVETNKFYTCYKSDQESEMNQTVQGLNATVTSVFPNKVKIEIRDIESFKVAGETLSVVHIYGYLFR